MKTAVDTFRSAVALLAHSWCETGLPSRQVLADKADALVRLREASGIRGLWEREPTLMTATMDDGLGQGLAIIEAYARAIGLQVLRLGLMKAPREIIDACRKHQPDYLGMTVLQYDTEDDLKTVADCLPPGTRIVAGGPVFIGDPDFAERTGTHFAARHVADFLRFMLDAA